MTLLSYDPRLGLFRTEGFRVRLVGFLKEGEMIRMMIAGGQNGLVSVLKRDMLILLNF